MTTTGLVAAGAAALTTTAAAAAGSAAGVSRDVAGAPIPLLGFAVVTALSRLIGLVLAVVLVHRARRPRRTFVRVTVVLTALSLVPVAITDVGGVTRALLVLTHLLAAAIVVPVLTERLPEPLTTGRQGRSCQRWAVDPRRSRSWTG